MRSTYSFIFLLMLSSFAFSELSEIVDLDEYSIKDSKQSVKIINDTSIESLPKNYDIEEPKIIERSSVIPQDIIIRSTGQTFLLVPIEFTLNEQ